MPIIKKYFFYFYIIFLYSISSQYCTSKTKNDNIKISQPATHITENNESIPIDLILLDEVVAMRISESGINPVFLSDAWFLNPFLGLKSIEQCVIEAALLSYANDHSIKKISDGAYKEYSEDYFDSLLTQKKISKDKIREILEEYNSNIEEMKKLLNNQFIIQQSIEMFFATSGSMHISDEEIMQYYHCMDKEENNIYKIQIGEIFLEKDNYNLDDIYLLSDKINWGEANEIKKCDLRKSLYGCLNAKDNEIFYYDYDSKSKAYNIYKLISHTNTKITLSDVYDEISRKIQMAKYEENYKKMIQNLMESDNIIYFDLKIKESIEKYIA